MKSLIVLSLIGLSTEVGSAQKHPVAPPASAQEVENLAAAQKATERFPDWLKTMPKPLTNRYKTKEDVCDEARKAGQKFVMMAMKSHGCDRGADKSCLLLTQILSDPRNLFIQKNFASYQIRTWRSDCFDHGTEARCVPFKKYEDLFNLFMEMRPAGTVRIMGAAIVAITSKGCVPVAMVSSLPLKYIEYHKKRAEVFNEMVRAELRKSPELKELGPEWQSLIDEPDSFVENTEKEPSLKETWDLLNTLKWDD
jgi:hypothetical protein